MSNALWNEMKFLNKSLHTKMVSDFYTKTFLRLLEKHVKHKKKFIIQESERKQ